MRCWHLLCMDASTIAKTDHQTCACSQVHRYADCQRTAEHPVDQHAVWKRNHGASSARALKNLIMWPIDSIIFYSLTKLIEQTGVFRMFHARTAAQAQK